MFDEGEQQHGQVAQHSEYADDTDGRVVTDQSELHDDYADDERFTTADTMTSAGPVDDEFQFPDQP